MNEPSQSNPALDVSKAYQNGAGPSRSITAVIEAVDVSIEAFVGEANLTIAELNACKIGSVITLDSGLQDAIELRLNGVIIAHGELVAVGDRFGVKITNLAS